jgi:hypothetical protein
LALYEAQKVEEMRAAEDARRREEFKRRVIEEARRTMLAEHAAALVSSAGRPGAGMLVECAASLWRVVLFTGAAVGRASSVGAATLQCFPSRALPGTAPCD